jgi:hypothetical protein
MSVGFLRPSVDGAGVVNGRLEIRILPVLSQALALDIALPIGSRSSIAGGGTSAIGNVTVGLVRSTDDGRKSYRAAVSAPTGSEDSEATAAHLMAYVADPTRFWRSGLRSSMAIETGVGLSRRPGDGPGGSVEAGLVYVMPEEGEGEIYLPLTALVRGTGTPFALQAAYQGLLEIGGKNSALTDGSLYSQVGVGVSARLGTLEPTLSIWFPLGGTEGLMSQVGTILGLEVRFVPARR